MEKVLSLDQASKDTGFAYFEGGFLKSHGVLTIDEKDAPAPERIHAMSELIYECINKYAPDFVIMEDVQNQGNISVVKLLGRLQGVIIGMCFQLGIGYRIMTPSEWRKKLNFVQGPSVKRKDLKQQSLDYVKNHFDLKVSDDESDAICIGVAYMKTK